MGPILQVLLHFINSQGLWECLYLPAGCMVQGVSTHSLDLANHSGL